MSYTEFGPSTGFSGVVELAMCELTDPANPVCHNGTDGRISGAGASAPAYLVVAPADPKGCENEGAYVAVDPMTGSVYVAYEHNSFTAILSVTNCGGETIQNVMNYIPASCLTATPTSSCAEPAAISRIGVTSLQAAPIPGYNRFPMNDFPRAAVSDPAGTVSMVWNDARQHATGDILLQSFDLVTLKAAQGQPVRVNGPNDVGGWHFLRGLRNADTRGDLNVSYYGRSTSNTALTNLFAALRVNPRATAPVRATKVTTKATDWTAVGSVIVPNFGDYTDDYFVHGTLYVAWSEGRLGFPKPFEDHVKLPSRRARERHGGLMPSRDTQARQEPQRYPKPWLS